MPGQTLSEIRGLLASAGLSPRHRFGQNFLIDLNLMRKLVVAAQLRAADVVLEVGPGTGSLTEMLLAGGARVIAVEIDAGLHELLRRRLAGASRLTLIGGDVLAGKHHVNPQVLAALAAEPPEPGGSRKLVANLPYQVATPLIVELLCGQGGLERLCVTIQREVGQRFAAAPRSEAYGAASVVVQTLADIELISVLPPTAFWPRPKVESIMLKITPRAGPLILPQPQRTAFAAFVQRGFEQRRKTIRRASDKRHAAARAAIEQAGLPPDARPEELSPANWRRWFDAWRAAPD
jgi:16S rRNA (adenine1518-N6/adenine1519-N6)-dimethyltransferase